MNLFKRNLYCNININDNLEEFMNLMVPNLVYAVKEGLISEETATEIAYIAGVKAAIENTEVTGPHLRKEGEKT
ncbi:MAG: hypothetical protein ACOCVB_00720 [Bacillota bacterium]